VAIHHRGPEGAEALTSPSFDESRRKIANHRTKDRFHRQPVKIVGFRGPGRLPPASSPPQALPPPLVSESRALDVISPPSDFSPWARPPSPTPAATEVASLSQTPLADFCNQNRARAHRSSDWSSPAARFRAPQCLQRLPSFGREQHEPKTEAFG
jgi:hypothetical protein